MNFLDIDCWCLPIFCRQRMNCECVVLLIFADSGKVYFIEGWIQMRSKKGHGVRILKLKKMEDHPFFLDANILFAPKCWIWFAADKTLEFITKFRENNNCKEGQIWKKFRVKHFPLLGLEVWYPKLEASLSMFITFLKDLTAKVEFVSLLNVLWYFILYFQSGQFGDAKNLTKRSARSHLWILRAGARGEHKLQSQWGQVWSTKWS